MKKSIILIFCSWWFLGLQAATITSTSSGGNWSSNATWVGNTIPTANDDVVINGPVNAPSGNTTVSSLVVNSMGVLRNLVSYSSAIQVTNNADNHGAIANNTSGWLNLNIQGDIENNGTLRINRLNIEGSGKVNLTQGSNGHFGNMTIYVYTNDTLHLKSNVKFDTITWYGSGVIDAGNHHLTFHRTTIRDQKIYGDGIFTMDNSTLYRTELNGNAEIRGDFFASVGLSLRGNLRIKGTIKNENAYSRTMLFYDSIINEGIVTNNNSGLLYVDIHGHLAQNGTFSPYGTYFKSGGLHYISNDAGKYFEGRYYASASDSIEIKSDIWFKKANYYGSNSSSVQAVFKTNGYVTKFDSCTVDYSLFRGNDSIDLNGSTLSYFSVQGNYSLSGNYFIGHNCNYHGHISQYGVIKNLNAYSRTLGIYGKLLNYGEITGNTSGVLDLDIHGDIHQAGVYKPYRTYFKSGGEHALSMDADKFYEGIFYATLNDSVKIDSDIWFKKANYYGSNTSSVQAVFKTNGFVTKFDSCSVDYSLFRGNDSIDLNGSTLSYFSVQGNYSLSGNYFIGFYCNYHGQISQYGVVKNQNAYSRTLGIYGKLLNYGEITSNTSGVLDLDIHGDIHQAGVYKPYRTYFKSGGEHELSMDADKFYEGDFYATLNDSVKIDSDIWFKKANYYGSNTSSVQAVFKTNGFVTKFDSCSVNHSIIKGNDSINFNGSTLSRTIILGDYKLSGDYIIGFLVDYIGVMDQFGSIKNQNGYGYNLKVTGSLNNHGSISSNNAGSLDIFINGNLHQNGIYKPYRTYFEGLDTSFLSQSNEKMIEGDIYIQRLFTSDQITISCSF